MIEALQRRRSRLAATLLAGSLTLAACSGNTHGVAGVELIDCKNGPKENTLIIDNFAKGKSFELGKNIGINFRLVSRATVHSDGDGNFNVTITDQDNIISKTHQETNNETVFQDGNEYFTVIGAVGVNNSTKLTVEATCTQP